jgi:hypothetical protein
MSARPVNRVSLVSPSQVDCRYKWQPMRDESIIGFQPVIINVADSERKGMTGFYFAQLYNETATSCFRVIAGGEKSHHQRQKRKN